MGEDDWSLARVPERTVVDLRGFFTQVKPRWEDGTPARWVRLHRTRSKDQPVASLLEAELVEQLAFADAVHDVLTHPVAVFLAPGVGGGM